MINITLNISTLKAATFCAARNDAHYYLRGVYIEILPDDNRVDITSTDGQVLSHFSETLEYCSLKEPVSVIVPLETVQAVLKMQKKGFVSLMKLSDGAWQLGAVTFQPIDGKYPDYRSVIPQTKDVVKGDAEGLQFTPESILKCHNAIRAFTGDGTSCGILTEYDDSKAVIHNGTPNAVSVCMSTRVKCESYKGIA